MASATPNLLAVDDTLGAALIGFSLSCVGFGIHSLQTFSYFQRYPGDKWFYKSLVAALWILDLIHSIFVGHTIYNLVIINYAKPLSLITGDIVWSLSAQIAIGALLGSLVKLCFTMRVWRFSSRNIWVTGFLVTTIIGQMGAALAFTIMSFRYNKFPLLFHLKVYATAALSLGAATDIMTAAALAYYLHHLRTGFKRSDSLITALTVYAVNTGALTSALSIITMVMYNVYTSSNFYFMAVYFVLIKLYSISFMCTLNTRRVHRGRGTDRENTTSQGPVNSGNIYMVHHRSTSHRVPQKMQSSVSQTKSQLAIGVHHEVSVMVDDDLESAKGSESPMIASPPRSYHRPYADAAAPGFAI
ncbi:hypothetical protein CYLTODRAFT_427363 [Cylindrobasidium torrendii FP15055 ss-10]|uniref:DUF6534 domain-containing protein n=1 Tax=Cylindrobasidium torrendii FP15055 ss-10 TaxID=1314674 RepID=A0A0D7AWT9_9AGAR|nr:hypothetical protein CYLTODRAFT_427363 [Cylindrobasidium torrendii FP15055 ss-10]